MFYSVLYWITFYIMGVAIAHKMCIRDRYGYVQHNKLIVASKKLDIRWKESVEEDNLLPC